MIKYTWNPLIFISLIVISAIFQTAFAPKSYALEGGDYTTPVSWSQHHSFGGTKYSTGGASIGGGEFDASVTSRTLYRSFKDDMISEYAYLRLKLSDLPAASGSASASIYFRGGFASEEFNPGFNPLKDSFYSERERASLRVYLANISVDSVIPNTLITLGRQYITHIDTEHVDGADAKVYLIGEKLSLHAFYALPVSYYAESPDTTVYGGGLEARPLASLRLRGEYEGYKDDKDSCDNNLIRFRADAKVGRVGTVYLNYRLLDGVHDAELGTVLDFKPIMDAVGGTTITASVRTIDDYYKEATTNFINRYSTSLGQEGKNTLLSGQLIQGVFNWLSVSIGGEGKIIGGTADYAHREFSHVFGSVDLINLTEGLYIQLNGSTWLAPADGKLKEESTFQLGGQVSYSTNANLNDSLEVWAGTAFNKYYYHIPEEFAGYSVIVRKSYEEDGRNFYIGCEYGFKKFGLTAALELSHTASSVYDSASGGFNGREDITAQLNLNWVL
jgi:hypothetical protein